MTQWFTFRTPPQREIRTVHTLRQHGFEVIVLMRPELKRAHSRHKVKSVMKREPMPALRPYIFVEMGHSDAWMRLHRAPVDIRAVGINGKPPRALVASGVDYITNPHRGLFLDTDLPDSLGQAEDAVPDYRAGDMVTVYGAGFDGLKGKVVDVRGKDAVVLMALFGREVESTIPVGSAIKAA